MVLSASLGFKGKYLNSCCEMYKIRRLEYFPWDQWFPTLILYYSSEFLLILRWYNVENALWENLIHGNFKCKCRPYRALAHSSIPPSLPPFLFVPLSLGVCMCWCVCLSCRHIFLFRKGLSQYLWKKLTAFITVLYFILISEFFFYFWATRTILNSLIR